MDGGGCMWSAPSWRIRSPVPVRVIACSKVARAGLRIGDVVNGRFKAEEFPHFCVISATQRLLAKHPSNMYDVVRHQHSIGHGSQPHGATAAL